ncbi:MAG: glycosyltransferase family 2 protein [Candidatus Woesearchaeota archaeon]
MQVFAVIPAYNESPNYYQPSSLDLVIESFGYAKNKDSRIKSIIVVNDGSTDFTAQRLANYKPEIEVLHHSRNLGKLEAFLTAARKVYKEILEEHKDPLETIILISDADIYIKPEDIKKIIDKISPLSIDMVICTYKQGEDICPPIFSGLRAIRFSSLMLWLDKSHKDYNLWQTILKPNYFDISEKRQATIGYSLETFLEGLILIYDLNVSILDLDINSRPRGLGPCNLDEINLGIEWASSLLYNTFSISI